MRKILVGLGVLVVMLSLLLMPVVGAQALTTAVVTINATPSFVSISVNNTSYDFGVVVATVDKATGTGYFGITDSSSVVTANTIQVTTTWEATTPGGNKWTYGAPGADTCQLKASDGDAAFDVTVPVTPAAAEALHSTAAAGDDWVFEVQLDAPASITYGDAQGCKFTISASDATP